MVTHTQRVGSKTMGDSPKYHIPKVHIHINTETKEIKEEKYCVAEFWDGTFHTVHKSAVNIISQKVEWKRYENTGENYQNWPTARELMSDIGKSRVSGDWIGTVFLEWNPYANSVTRCAINTLVALDMIRIGFVDIVINDISEYLFPEGVDTKFLCIARKMFVAKQTKKVLNNNKVEKKVVANKAKNHLNSIFNTMTAVVISKIAGFTEYYDNNKPMYSISGGTVLVSLFGEKILALIAESSLRNKIQKEIAPIKPTITDNDLFKLEQTIKALPDHNPKGLPPQQHRLIVFTMKESLLRDLERCYDNKLHIRVKTFATTMERWLLSNWYRQVKRYGNFESYKGRYVKFQAFDVAKWGIDELMFKARPRLDEYTIHVNTLRPRDMSYDQRVVVLLEDYRCPTISSTTSNGCDNMSLELDEMPKDYRCFDESLYKH